ncbi:hypothetical protein T310_7486 [Rasamsonia emersonii CBS 393.64]|uniref:Flavin reductase like domain-containing protein n=1 Tax=Rasamsonia emersonii (strain ATCC 16479 / CBS 393.64 / IMI 116815) TaxID=1408163 RepID=A0A0F4YK86_RASE3|nr:hypothetical protein T310_7486 [Rasamsonia emersonii CBS 393.64]KKA18550.1 hypothetical protein T310_7486 [Rasamsonia emersonii CBS 393.64]
MPPRKRRAPSETTPNNNTNTNNTTNNDDNTEQPLSSKSATATTTLSPYPINKVYRLIEPGPVLLVTTGSLKENTHNIMTIGFHMMMQHESPALIGAIIGPWDASYALLKKHRECVLAVPSVDMAATAVDIGNCSGSDVDKFEKFGLEVLPAEKVEAPLVVGIRREGSGAGRNESGDAAGALVLANIECVVEDTKMASKYGMIDSSFDDDDDDDEEEVSLLVYHGFTQAPWYQDLTAMAVVETNTQRGDDHSYQ